MSFSSDTKEELCRVPVPHGCCANAESYGILLFAHTFNQREIRIITASDAFAKRLPKLFRRAFGLEFDELPAEDARGKRTFRITDPAKLQTIASVYGQETAAQQHVNFGMLENECCRQSFLRGAFFTGGSLTEPSKRYHLEFASTHRSVVRETYTLMLEMGFAPKESDRNGNSVVYFKQSDAIEDLLTTMGASNAAMDIMQMRAEKSMNNVINRRVNCDSANADKIVSAAAEQLDAIREIERDYGLFNLPEALQQTAMLRIANPEASLTELAALAIPPVSKSCISHRMKKLMEYKG